MPNARHLRRSLLSIGPATGRSHVLMLFVVQVRSIDRYGLHWRDGSYALRSKTPQGHPNINESGIRQVRRRALSPQSTTFQCHPYALRVIVAGSSGGAAKR